MDVKNGKILKDVPDHTGIQGVASLSGPCVIAIITHSAVKLAGRTIGRDKLLWGIYLVSLACTGARVGSAAGRGSTIAANPPSAAR